MTRSETYCASCTRQLPNDVAGAARVPCPDCGSTMRSCLEAVEDSVAAYDSIRGKAKDLNLPSKKKLRWDSYSGYEDSHKYGKIVKVERTFDKDADLYTERVIDPESGEVLHECIEPLSKHINHGTAKPKQP